jgi:hypothetical protein
MKKIFVLFLFLAMITVFLTSCGAESRMDEATLNKGYASEEDTSGTVTEDAKEIDDTRKIIKTYNLSLETKSFDKDTLLIVSEAEAMGGYVASSSVSGNHLSSDRYSSRSANYTVRIPASALDSYIEAISSVCNVYSSSLTTEDVTDSYYGIQSQLESLVIQERKLTEMLESAKTLQDMIIIDDKLTSVRAEINALNYRLQSMDKSVNYSYVYIRLNEVHEYHEEEPSYFEELGDAFVGSIRNFVDVLGNIVIVLIWVLPFGIVAAAIVLLIIFLERRSRKQRTKRQMKDTDNK